MKLKSTLTLLAALATTTLSFAIPMPLIVNGGFDDGPLGAPTFDNNGFPFAGSIDVSGTAGLGAFTTGWTAYVPNGHAVTFNTQAGGGSFPTQVDGGYMYNVGGFNNEKGVGVIYQDFTTVMGQSYQLNYFISSMPGAGALNGVSVHTQILDGGNSFNLITGSVDSTTSESFVAQGFTFTAGSTSTRLSFTDLTSGSSTSQLNIDAVSVTAIPEPSTYAAMAGAAMLGLAVWRRRQVAGAPVAA